jgi:N utilization substance protein A
MKGSRVQSIIRELRGEKIDIIQWSDDVVTFATNAISPAKVSRVTTLDSSEERTEGSDRVMEIVVEDSQLSLAIGKKGQNVRLASRLIGWRIDIKSEEEKRAEIEDQIERMQAATPLEQIEGLTPGLIKKLIAAEIMTVEQLADLAPEDLEALPGIGGKTIDKIRDELSEYYAALPTYQDDLVRSTQEAMFSKSVDEPEDAPEEVVAEEVAGEEEGAADKVQESDDDTGESADVGDSGALDKVATSETEETEDGAADTPGAEVGSLPPEETESPSEPSDRQAKGASAEVERVEEV